MDDALRSLERRARAAPDDPALARALRAALERAAGDPEVTRRLDALHGVLAVPSAIGDEWDPGDASAPRWRRLALGPEAPLLRPTLPPGAVRERWRAQGRALWIGAGLVLVEQRYGALEAYDAATGEARWRVPSVGPERQVEADDERRTARLGWAVASWGAVEIGARWEADLQVRRAGRWTPHGRTTEREVAGRGAVQVEVALQVVLAPGGSWSREQPRSLIERAKAGAPLLDGDLAPALWDDDLLALALDPLAPRFAVRWRDPDQEWAIYEAGLAADGSPWAGPAGWSAAPDDDPMGLARAGIDALPLAIEERHERGEMRSLWVQGDHPMTGQLVRLGGLHAAAALALDDAVLVRGERDGEHTLHVARAGDDPDGDLASGAELLPVEVAQDDLELRFWDEPDNALASAVILLPSPSIFVVQLHGDVVGLGP